MRMCIVKQKIKIFMKTLFYSILALLSLNSLEINAQGKSVGKLWMINLKSLNLQV